MSFFNFGKEKINKSINEEKINKEKEFGSLSDSEIIEQKELLIKLSKGTEGESVSNNRNISKESEEDKNNKIQKILESIKELSN